MADRWFPLHPDPEQLRRQAKELLRDARAGDADALAEWRQHGGSAPDPVAAQLADAQHILARSYGFPSWPRLVLSCRLTNAIWEDDLETVRSLAQANPELVQHRAHRNWGAPMSFAANLGRDRIVEVLHALGARDLDWAFARACLQGRIETARRLYALGGRPGPDAVMWSCETQSADGLALLLELGAPLADAAGDPLAPVGLLLETYCRNRDGRRRCLELAAERGVALPDTPAMAVWRGRTDLLEAHLRRDPGLFRRTLGHHEIYPLELGCHGDPAHALHATPMAGATLLHLCVDQDEIEVARWMLDHGADVDARAAVDADGFGGHTALFGCVVAQPGLARRKEAPFARLLLERGADPNARASLRKRILFSEDESEHTYRDVTPLAWGQRFHNRGFVSEAALEAITEAGGRV